MLTVLGSVSVLAQGAPNPFGEPVRTRTNHLTAEASVSATSVAPGDRVTVLVDVTPRPSMHVYAPGKHDYQVVGLSIDRQAWLDVAATRYPPSESYHFQPLNETVPVYSKPFRLTREVTILSTPDGVKALKAAGAPTLKGQLTYQACDDKLCYAPAKVRLEFKITVK
jgi:hypothetical protein